MKSVVSVVACCHFTLTVLCKCNTTISKHCPEINHLVCNRQASLFVMMMSSEIFEHICFVGIPEVRNKLATENVLSFQHCQLQISEFH